MAERIDFHRVDGETTEVWLGRLRSIDRETLTMTQRIGLSHSKDLAEKVAKREGQPPERPRSAETPRVQTSALQQVKDAYIRLSPEEQREFILWLAPAAPVE
jgi:hypothetical protein